LNAGYDPSMFERLAQLEAGSWWFRSRNRLIRRTARDWFPGAIRILEVGCGTGFTLQALHQAFPHARLVASDMHPEGLQIAARRVPRAEFVTLDLSEMPYRSEFDLVAAFDVVEHINDDQAALDGLALAVRPGGGLILTVPQHMWLWSEADENAGHARRYARGELLTRLKKAGFLPLSITSFVTFLMPLLIASRLRSRLGVSFDPFAEFQLPRALDRGFDAIASIEQALIRAGASMPVGGSLLVAAVRSPFPMKDTDG
jgi:2-polyprenyl-3-methyl-5-hydroxy-6-metoxy-1,4-benzoquinol methylase